MSQGVLLFDMNLDWFCNQRYIEMYGLSPDLVQPGCTLSSLSIIILQWGRLGNPEEYIEVCWPKWPRTRQQAP
jgi:hypothetical protein